jgi:hypothetical protein
MIRERIEDHLLELSKRFGLLSNSASFVAVEDRGTKPKPRPPLRSYPPPSFCMFSRPDFPATDPPGRKSSKKAA